MKIETVEIIGAFVVIVGTAAILSIIHKRRKNALLRNMVDHLPRFIEHQLNSTHKRLPEIQ